MKNTKCTCSSKDVDPWVGSSQYTGKGYAGCYTCGAVWQTHYMLWVLSALALAFFASVILQIDCNPRRLVKADGIQRRKEMAEFKKPSPEVEAVYEQIVALDREGVWVPATSNGGLRQLLAEMELRGWKVIPPEEKDEKKQFFVGVSESLAAQPKTEQTGEQDCAFCSPFNQICE